MADGRYEDVTSMIEVDIGLGERTVRMQLLILHNIIDALVLGLDFLTRVGARVECAGLTVIIPVCSTGQGRPKEKLSVAVVERVDFSEEDVDEFLRSELTSLENVQGTSTVAEHRITMKDDQAAVLPKKPQNASGDQRQGRRSAGKRMYRAV
ncbi:GM17415 [Drosophila sechellia]|uniref:GM17415 n=1 Tax=Drosophila sechellia TaxID=7238 RepID=B4IMF1_DROSE|nr:GM17415 [Drosophila sechellia]